MNFKNNKGSITLFVLVGLLFMASVLMLLYAFTVNKSKIVKEQYNIISDIYSHKDGDANAYNRAYTYLRGQNKQTATKMVQNTSVIELENTFKGNLSNYRIYGNGVNQEGNNLPAEYQEVEYIESTGTQYIDTEYIPNYTTKIETKINIESYIIKATALMGSRSSITSGYYYVIFLRGDGGSMRWDYGTTKIHNGSVVVGDNTIIKDEQNNYLNNKVLTSNTEETFECKDSLYLFGVNTDGSFSSGASVKMYYTKIYDSGILVRDLLPCKRKFNNEVGMYDLVNNVFYTNQGTGVFSKGEDILTAGDLVTDEGDENYGKYKISIKSSNEAGESVIKDIYLNEPLEDGEYIDFKTSKIIRDDGTEEFINLPEILTYDDYTKIEVLTENIPTQIEVEYKKYNIGYTQLEYIESTGTQYIDTDLKMSEDIIIELKNTVADGSLLGVQDNDNCFAIAYAGGEEYFRYYSPNGKVFSSSNTAIYRIEGNKVYVNGVLSYTQNSYSYSDIDLTMYLFARNLNNAASGFSKRKIYYCKIWDNETLVRDFIPVIRMSDGEIGLYDRVNDMFYENTGTGEFIAGPEV